MERTADHLIIYGAPTEQAFTAKLLQTVTDALPHAPQRYSVFHSAPKPCDDCGYCKAHLACKYPDLDLFFKQFAAAKQVIFAFPVYNNSFPAPLKALLDRFQRFYAARFFQNKRPPMSGRREVTLVMTMGSDKDVTPLILEQLRPIFTICGCTLKKSIVLTGTDRLSKTDPLSPIITEYES